MNTEVASRKAPRSKARLLASISLVGGAALGFVGVYVNTAVPGMSYLGIAIAFAAGTAAATLGWREYRNALLDAGEHEVEMMRGFTARLQQERSTNSDVLDLIGARNAELLTELKTKRTQVGELRQQVSELRGNFETLATEHSELQATHDALLDMVKHDSDIDVVSLPRRRTADGTEVSFEDSPTVANLNLQRLVAPFVEEAVRQAN